MTTVTHDEEAEVLDETADHEVLVTGPARPLKFKVTDRLNNDEEGYVAIPLEEGDGHKLFSEVNYDAEEDVWVGYGLTNIIFDPVRMEALSPEE